MPLAVLFVALAQVADAVTFAIGVRYVGIDDELNPLARLAFHTDGLPLALGLKLALAVLLCSLVALMRGSPRWPARLAAGIAGGLGILGAVGNTLAALPFLLH